jgi:hypothetical protein
MVPHPICGASKHILGGGGGGRWEGDLKTNDAKFLSGSSLGWQQHNGELFLTLIQPGKVEGDIKYFRAIFISY